MTNSKQSLSVEERCIIRNGERLAAQLGGAFEVVPQKLRDFRALRSRSPLEDNSND